MDFSNPYLDETVGKEADLTFLKEDDWLHDTAVSDRINQYRGRWYVTMVYVSIHDPLRLVCVELGDYPTSRKATLYANIFKRGIRKDARGTLTINTDALHICSN